MAKGYWVLHIDVTDPAGFKDYAAAANVVFADYQPTFLVGGGAYEAPEGNLKSRHVVLEFETYEKAIECYNSDAYQKAVRLREPVSSCDMVILEGK